MKPKLRRNQAYVPGRPLFPKQRGFWRTEKLPPVLWADAYEMSSGEPVTVMSVDPVGIIKGTFRDENGFVCEELWLPSGHPKGSVRGEFYRPLQNRVNLAERLQAHVEAMT